MNYRLIGGQMVRDPKTAGNFMFTSPKPIASGRAKMVVRAASGEFWAENKLGYPVHQDDVHVPSTSASSVFTTTEVLKMHAEILQKISHLTEALERLEGRVEAIEQHRSEEPIPEVRDVSDAQAADEIVAFYDAHKGENMYPDDVAEALKLDFLQTVRLCEQLVQEGRLGRGHL